jgi:serine/threonine protein phosphatase PrpC
VSVTGDLRCLNPACNEPVHPEDVFCEACGQPVPTAEPERQPRGGWRAVAAADTDPDRSEAAFADLAAVSDPGLKRLRNEDAMALARLDEEGVRILIVCDGVSTSGEPAAASRAAAQAALAYLVAAVRFRYPEPEAAMREAVTAAQAAVCAIPFRRPGQEELPATTLVAALVRDGAATIGWVGDSRAYFVSDADAWRLSRDDTWAMEQVELGLMPEEEAMADPRAHALTRWLGDQEGELEPSVCTFQIPASGCLLLCSDGLWNYAPTAGRMRELVMQFPGDATAMDVARGLTEFARSSGGADNITVAVAFV